MYSQTLLIPTHPSSPVQLDLTYPHTSILDEIVDRKTRELDKWGSSSIVYSRIIADLFR